jgi:hypothetical protein
MNLSGSRLADGNPDNPGAALYVGVSGLANDDLNELANITSACTISMTRSMVSAAAAGS